MAIGSGTSCALAAATEVEDTASSADISATRKHLRYIGTPPQSRDIDEARRWRLYSAGVRPSRSISVGSRFNRAAKGTPDASGRGGRETPGI
jgi:hypothetical protein